MCTVTYLPKATGCLLTSSRDEKLARPKALPPAFYQHNHQQILYPKDAAAGGTWIAVTNSGNAAVLLNGAFTKHVVKPPYRKSRGLIFLEIINNEIPLTAFELIDLENIEPFTVVLFFDRNLFECRWDGTQKYVRKMDAAKPHIWSSATLYTDEAVQQRKAWFSSWCAVNDLPEQPAIIDFHATAGDGDSDNSIRMNRNDTLLTVSITSIHAAANSADMLYYDLHENGGFIQRQIKFKSLVTT